MVGVHPGCFMTWHKQQVNTLVTRFKYSTSYGTCLGDQVELVDIVLPREERLPSKEFRKDAAHRPGNNIPKSQATAPHGKAKWCSCSFRQRIKRRCIQRLMVLRIFKCSHLTEYL